jgi:hypothetical protein
MRRFFLFYSVTILCSLAIAGAAPAKQAAGGSYTLVAVARLVHPGHQSHTAAEVTSSGPLTETSGWGAVELAIPSGLTIGQLNNLSTDYKFVVGSCWGGSPRFEAWVTTPTGATKKIFFYIGPPPNYTGCPSGVWANTGNIASPSSPVDDSEIGGGFSDPYSTVQANYGSYPVTGVYLDADGAWSGSQTVDFDNTQVNNTLYTYEQ